MRKIIFYRFENGKCPVVDYFESLSNKQVEKIFFVLDIVEQLDIVPKNFFKKLEATDDILEVRVQYRNNIFRLLGFFDINDLVVLNHAFTKKIRKFLIKKSKSLSKEKEIVSQEGGWYERFTAI